MSKKFMLDIETTGVDPKRHEVLQIAAVEMNFTEKGFWDRGRIFNFYQHTDRKPEDEFAKKYMKEIYRKCQDAEFVPVAEVRQNLLQFFKDCGAESPNVYFCGWNVGVFDIQFLAHHNYLKPAQYINGELIGDSHYRVYEMSGAINLLANLQGHNESNNVIKQALKVNPAPRGQRHDALFDCERQICILNGIIKILKESHFN